MIFDNLDELFNYIELVHDLNPHNFFLKLDKEDFDRYHVHLINEVEDGNLVVSEQIGEVLLLENTCVELLWCSLVPNKPEHIVYHIYQCTKTISLHQMLGDMVHHNDDMLSEFYWGTNQGSYDSYLFVAGIYMEFSNFSHKYNRHNV